MDLPTTDLPLEATPMTMRMRAGTRLKTDQSEREIGYSLLGYIAKLRIVR